MGEDSGDLQITNICQLCEAEEKVLTYVNIEPTHKLCTVCVSKLRLLLGIKL